MERGDKAFNILEYALKTARSDAEFRMSSLDIPLCLFRYFYHCHGDQGSSGARGSNTNRKGLG